MFIKVFGERNTGTHFLIQLLRDNTNAELLIHEDGPRQRSRENFNKILTCYPHFAEKNQALRSLIIERFIDSDRERDFAENYGWKHAAVNAEELKRNPKFHNTLFVCLIRNPWRFISALHRRPYNIFPAPKTSLEEFIQSPLLANARDNLIEPYISSPVELWNKKVASYIDLKDTCPTNVVIAYYEEIICDIPAFLSSLRFFCKTKAEPVIPTRSTKRDTKTLTRDNKTFSDYKAEVERYSPQHALGVKACNLITERINTNIFEQTIYKQYSQYNEAFSSSLI